MENFNEEEKKPKKNGRKIFKYLILIASSGTDPIITPLVASVFPK